MNKATYFIEVEVDYSVNGKRDIRHLRHLKMDYASKIILPSPAEIVLELHKQGKIKSSYSVLADIHDSNHIVVQSIYDIHIHSIGHVDKIPKIWG